MATLTPAQVSSPLSCPVSLRVAGPHNCLSQFPRRNLLLYVHIYPIGFVSPENSTSRNVLTKSIIDVSYNFEGHVGFNTASLSYHDQKAQGCSLTMHFGYNLSLLYPLLTFS